MPRGVEVRIYLQTHTSSHKGDKMQHAASTYVRPVHLHLCCNNTRSRTYRRWQYHTSRSSKVKWISLKYTTEICWPHSKTWLHMGNGSGENYHLYSLCTISFHASIYGHLQYRCANNFITFSNANNAEYGFLLIQVKNEVDGDRDSAAKSCTKRSIEDAFDYVDIFFPCFGVMMRQ